MDDGLRLLYLLQIHQPLLPLGPEDRLCLLRLLRLSQQPLTGSSKKSSSISVSFSATGSRPSGQSTGATSQGQALPAALMIPDIKPQLFDSMRKASPDINSVLKTGISSLSKSIKNPGQVNVQDIAKANSLLGKHGPETQQVASTFKQLTARRLVTDTVIPGVLTIPSPTLHWGKALMSGFNPGGSSGRASGGASGGAGDGLLGTLLGLANLICEQSIDVGGLGAALDLSLADAYELNARFPPQDLRKVVQAQTAIKALSAELKPILNDLAQFITETGQSLQAIKRHAPKFVIREAFAVNKNTILDGKRITNMIGPNKIKTHCSGNTIGPGRQQQAFFDSDKGSNATMLLPLVNPTWDVRRRPKPSLHLRMLSYDP
ncbi:MAG: hypothetical protein LQ344_002543 [Seirophora lacunosa]|nr:MAG: hypothetical protein LQ344_002543 [Seirophora lacunosa]